MAVSYNTVTVTNAATLIKAASPLRQNIKVANTSSSVTVYYGPDSSVTASNGIPLYPNQTLENETFLPGYKGAIYGITSASTADVRYFEYTANL